MKYFAVCVHEFTHFTHSTVATVEFPKVKVALNTVCFFGRRPGSLLSCLGQGCSGGIRTHDIQVMSLASDRTAFHCDKIESTELLHPHKSFTINGGIEHPSLQRLSRFLPSPHALRLLTWWILRCSKNAIFYTATNPISSRIGKMKTF